MLKRLLVFLFPISVFAQKIELGIGMGPTFYKGDLQPTFRPLNPKIGANLFARYNATRVFSFKANGMAGFVGGNDARSGNPLNKKRNYSFTQTIADYNVQAEYNFLNFRTHNGKFERKWTPYLFGGLGQHFYLNEKYISGVNVREISGPRSSSLNASYGIGFKKIWKDKWNFGLEFSTRARIGDKFDGYSIDPDTNLPDSQYSPITVLDEYPNTIQNDKYFHLTFSISYCFYKVYCPPN